MDKIFGTLLSAAVIYFLRWPIIIAISWVIGWQFGYDREWWGIPPSSIKVENVRMVGSGPLVSNRYVEGTLTNNNDIIVKEFVIQILFYRCRVDEYITDLVHQCMEVKADRPGKFEVSGFVIDPHHSRSFNIRQPNYVGDDIFTDLWYVEHIWENDEYNIHYTARVDFVAK